MEQNMRENASLWSTPVPGARWEACWAEALRRGLDPERAIARQEDEAGLARRKELDPRFYLYFRRNISLLLSAHPKAGVAVALVDADGCVVDLVGPEGRLARLREDGVVPGVRLALDTVGPNAVSAGVAAGMPCASVGEENYHRSLRKYAMYFCPILIQQLDPPFTPRSYGGAAVILPREAASDECPLLAAMIAHDLLLNTHYSQRTYRRYEMTGMGVLSVDTGMVRGRMTITYGNQALFDLLGLPYEDLSGSPAERFLDPAPQNQEFWQIVQQAQRVSERELTLSIRGKPSVCIVTTDTFDQPMLNITGVVFFISTPQWQSAQVSQRMGNNAVRTFENIVGQSPVMKSTIQRARLMANTDSNIMLWGESGVGKDVFAQAIHNTSRRKGKPFIAVNCGALPRDLIASELFGYEGGAFTGARRQGNMGKFELANGGTLFLDEIGELPLDLQATLLRVVEQKSLTRLGGGKEISVDVKIISATNADLPEMVEQKRFREDLYYRLSTIQLDIPPLRDRGEDVILLARHFIRTISARVGRTGGMELTPESQKLLLELPWRGNVRELQNLIESVVQLYPGPWILPEYIRENIRMEGRWAEPAPPERPQTAAAPARPAPVRGVRGKRAGLTREEIVGALEVCGGNRSDAAKALGVARRTLYRYMELWGL